MIRITKDGKPAAGNPQTGSRPEIYSYGHRNVQGIDFHPETGGLWVSEMGPQGGDELNLVEAGKNYGWPDITYGIEYNDDKISGGATQKEGMEQPVYFWDPVLSPSGMTFYRGDAIPEWKNNLFITGLNSHHIARIVLENNKVVGEERIAADQQQRFRAITEGNDGALYAVTDEGKLYRIGSR
ncbi:PQQ-dependent sugar dehydrogenase [Pontibacter qinzhouensis]|uniref:PQQ-dependent sugar dehydrogenase n=1 Tax=Pontibacter qinzhouensis TaxID=2603253 RepID=A0A5C8IY02_9BACT|nr:PQQ-dependent sugar dehydrogenase [Pontibacter qinzhouensis]